MLAGRSALALGKSRLERVYERGARPSWLDHIVDVASLRGGVGICKLRAVISYELLPARLGVLSVIELTPKDDVYGSLRAHDSDLGGWPGEVEVGPDVL